MAIANNKTKKATAKARKGSREFVNIDNNVGLEFEVEKGSIWMHNGIYNPSISIDIDDTQTLSGFTRKISIQDCVCEVIKNARGYAELLIRPADSE